MEFPDEKKRKLEETTNGTEVHAPAVTKDELKKMLEPLTKEQLLELLANAKHEEGWTRVLTLVAWIDPLDDGGVHMCGPGVAWQHFDWKRSGSRYADVANEINEFASKDPAHRKLFVRGLAWETTTVTLREAFSQYGEIEEGAVIVDKGTGKSRGFGFITFKQMDSAYRALREPSKRIDGRMTVCNLAAQGGGATAQVVPTADISLRKLYVGSLSYDTTSETLLNFFAQYGEIEEGAVAYDKNTNKSRGFAFVTFKSAESARRACAEPGKTIDGRPVVVKIAAEGQKEKAAQQAAAAAAAQAPMMAQAQAMPQMQQGMQPSYGSPYAINQQMQSLGAYRPQVATSAPALGMAYGSPAGVAAYAAQPSYPGMTGTPQYATSPIPMQQQYTAYAAQPYQTAAGSNLGMGTTVATTGVGATANANMPLYFTGTQ